MNTEYVKLTLTGTTHKIAERKGAWVRVFMGDGTIKSFRGAQFTYVDAPDTAVTAEEAFGAANARRPAPVPASAASAPKRARETAPRAPRARKPLSERKNGKVDALYLQFYKQYRRQDGVLSVDNGDDVAAKLRGMDLVRVYAYAAGVLNESVEGLKARYEHLNPGMQRMNLGNRVRAFLKGQ